MLHTCAWYLRSEERASDSLELELGLLPSEPPHGYWEPNPGFVEEQPLLLTTELTLQRHGSCLEGVN